MKEIESGLYNDGCYRHVGFIGHGWINSQEDVHLNHQQFSENL